MKKYFIILIAICAASFCSAQTFVPDSRGHVTDPSFQKFIKQRGYQLMTAFDTIAKKPLVMRAKAIKDGKWVTITTKGEELKEPEPYHSIDVVPSRIGDGISIDAPVEEKSEIFEQANSDGKRGTRNKVTKKIGLPIIYDEIVWYGNGLLSIKTDGKTGLAKTNGTILLKPTYESINVFSYTKQKRPESFTVYNKKKYGLLNKNYQETIQPKYDYILSCSGCDVSDNLVIVSLDKKMGLVTKTGKELLPPAYERIQPLSNIKAPILIRQNKKSGLADSLGHILIQPTLDDIKYQYEDKTIRLILGNRYGVADLNGKILAEPIYQNIRPFSAGTAVIESNDRYGMINSIGKIIIPITHYYLYRFDNYFVAEKDKQRGLLDLQGKELLPFEYQELAYAGGKKFFFKKNNNFGMINSVAKVITKFDYEDVQYVNGYLIIKEDGKYGVADINGKLLIPAKYDRFVNTYYFLHDGATQVVLNGKKGIIDLYGNEYFEQL